MEKQEKEVDEVRLEIFSREFPGIKEKLSFKSKFATLKSIEVKRITHDLLKQKFPRYLGKQTGVLFFFDNAGHVLAEVGSIPPHSTYRWWKPWTWSLGAKLIKEIASDALVRLGHASANVCFALEIWYYDNGTGVAWNSVYEVTATVYKSPKDFSLKNWTEQARQARENAMRQQAEAAKEKQKSTLEEIKAA